MPTSTKLNRLRDERERLSQRTNLSANDEKRIQVLSRLIADEEKTSGSGMVANRNPAPYTAPWKSTAGAATRLVDSTSTYRAATTDQLRMQFGMTPLTDMGFLSPNADKTGLEVNPALDGYHFGKNGQTMSGLQGNISDAMGQTLNQYGQGRSIDMLNGMSVRNMIDFYYSLSDKELVKFQSELVQAGFFPDGKPPQLGVRDDKTTGALADLMKTWMAEPNQDIRGLLDGMKRANAGKLDEGARKMLGHDSSGTGVVSDEVANVTVTDEKTLDSMVDKVSQSLFGQFIDPAQKAALIKQLQDEEKTFKTDQVKTQFTNAVTKAQNDTKAANGGNDLDAFMTALIGQESGGDANAVNADSGAMGVAQIMPENWGPWSAEAGANPADFSEANQRKVIKYKLAQYYQAYGNWRDVAVAWYGGQGGVDRVHAGGGFNDEDGYPSLNAYADSVLSKMQQYTGTQLAAARTPQLTVNTVQDLASADVRAQDALKRLDPAAYAGHEFARNAENFFSLLRGVN